jgi:hypothetical protein
VFRLEEDRPKRKIVAIKRGDRFGRLTVMRLESVEGRRRLWRCRCDCGRHKVVPTRYLTSKETKSCGCLLIDNGRLAMRRLHAKVA